MTPNRRTFLKQFGLGAGALVFLPGASRPGFAADAMALARSAPEAQGVSSAGIEAFLDALAASRHELHSFMMLRHGRVVAEAWWAPYSPALNHTLYSMSKSFTSTAIGMAAAEGRLSVEDKVVSFFPNDLPETISEHLAALRVRDLLTMSVGHGQEPTQAMVRDENWVRTFLAWPITQAPGTRFLYNSGATYMLSAIVQQVSGLSVLEYLRPRLFEPLGIENAAWETCPKGINTGGWGLSIQSEGLAKFGQLYLQNGLWQGKQILPEAWVKEATTFKIQQPAPAKPSRPTDQNDWLQGYCYQFWRCRHNGFRGDGAFGQYTIVLPEADAVIVFTAETNDMQGQLDLVWAHLLPAMHPDAMPADSTASDRLKKRLAALALPLPKGLPDCPRAAAISGKPFLLEPNAAGFQSATLSFEPGRCLLRMGHALGSHDMACGLQNWLPNQSAMPGTPPRLISGGSPAPGTKSAVMAAAAWLDENTLELTWRYTETPHHDTVTCRFDGDKIQITFLNSITGMNPNARDPRPALLGVTR